MVIIVMLRSRKAEGSRRECIWDVGTSCHGHGGDQEGGTCDITTSPSLYKSESLYADTMSVPADNILHLHIDNLTHDWGKYTLKFDVKSPGSMVRLFQYCSDPSLPVQILVIAIRAAGDTAFIKLEEGDDVKPSTTSTHVTAQPSVILSCHSVPGLNDMHPKIHSYRIKPARSTCWMKMRTRRVLCYSINVEECSCGHHDSIVYCTHLLFLFWHLHICHLSLSFPAYMLFILVIPCIHEHVALL